MTDNKLKIYYDALDRLKRDNPSIVARYTRISLSAVSIEAGRSSGSIKKSRKLYSPLIKDIAVAAKSQRENHNLHDLEIRKLKLEVSRYRKLYEDALAREVVLSSRLLDEIDKI